MKIEDAPRENCATVSKDGYLMCKDLSKWVSGLIPLPGGYGSIKLMQDVDTGDIFIIIRTKE